MARVLCWMAMLLGVTSTSVAQGSARGAAESATTFPQKTPRRLAATVARLVEAPGVVRAHWGVAVAAMDGTPLYGVNEGQFFQPASNAKLFTTAAAMALLGPERVWQTDLVGRGVFRQDGTMLEGDLLLVGQGDAGFCNRALPYVAPGARPRVAGEEDVPTAPDPLQCLAEMADKVVASGLKVITGHVVGDDSAWPSQPYPQDWSVDDLVWGYGAPVSALAVADNQVRLVVTPAGTAGEPATVVLDQLAPYYVVEASVMTMPPKGAVTEVQVERLPGSRRLRVYGRIALGAVAEVEEIAIEDPAEYAAVVLKGMLEARGVRVEGRARALHAPMTEARAFRTLIGEPIGAKMENSHGATERTVRGGCSGCVKSEASEQRVLASSVPVPLVEDVVLTNKLSVNLHAEMMLRQMGVALGDSGTTAQGMRVLRSFLAVAGVAPDDVVFYDGSGLSGHDLVTPRAAVRLLVYASTQPWFATWRASLPIGGVDGSLAMRFGEKSGLRGRVFAKTGTLGEARALSGYVSCASGRTVAFSVMVTDHAPGGTEDREVMDQIVEAIAAVD